MPRKKVDPLVQIQNSLSQLDKRVSAIEQRMAMQPAPAQNAPASAPSQSNPMRIVGGILLALGLFMSIIGFPILSLIFRNSFIRLLSPLGWIFVIAGIVLLVTQSKGGTRSPAGQQDDEDNGEIFAQPSPAKMQAQSTPQARKTASGQPAQPKEGTEANIGRKWFARLGIISITLSVAFFLIYAIQNKFIGPTGQIAIGIAIGLVLLFLGELLDRKTYTNYARTLTGGGFAILYFSFYAAHNFHHLISSEILALVLLTAVIVFAVVFSLRYNSPIIAAEAFLLGYVAPLIIGQVNLFSLFYAVMLSVGLILVSYARGWTTLSFGGMIFNFIIHGVWLGRHGNDPNASIIHTIFILLYIVLFTLLGLFMRKNENERNEQSSTPQALIYIVFVLSYFFFFMLPIKVPLLISLIVLVLGSIVLAMNQQLNFLPIISVVGTFLIQYIWLAQNDAITDAPLHILLVCVYLLLFTLASLVQKQDVTNTIMVLLSSFAAFSLNLIVILQYYPDMDGIFALCLAIFYLVIAYAAYGKEKPYSFNTFAFLSLTYLTIAVPLQLNQNWITFSWMLEALLLLLLSFRLRENVIRLLSSVVAGVASIKILFYDSWTLTAFSSSNILESTRFFSFFWGILILYTMAWLYKKNKKLFDEHYKIYTGKVALGIAIVATAFTTIILTLEILSISGEGEVIQMMLSIAWIVQALVLLVYGFASKVRAARIMGIVLFFISIFKIFLFDLSMLETLARIFSFFFLGVILLVAAFLYNKYKEYI